MKKLVLALSLILAAVSQFNAQCTPGANFADSLFGAWPDTTTNFPNGMIGVAYTTDLNFKVPSDAGDIDPVFAGYTIVNFSVDSVTGLPPGIDYTCNISNCTYAGGANGCAQLSGTCNVAGYYVISIHITANLVIFGQNVPVPYSFEGYHINISDLGLLHLDQSQVSISPNPVQDLMNIQLKQIVDYEGISIYNAAGKLILSQDLSSNSQLILDLSGLERGMYFLKMEGGTVTEMLPFVKE